MKSTFFDLLLALKQVRSPATQGTAYAVVLYITYFFFMKNTHYESSILAQDERWRRA